MIDFEFTVTGKAHFDAYLDEEDIRLMFERTRQDIGSALQRKLTRVVCAEHDREAGVLVRAVYDREIEQMDVSYSVDSCCQPFLLRIVQILHRTG